MSSAACRYCRHCKEMPAVLPECRKSARKEPIIEVREWADGPPPHWCPGFERDEEELVQHDEE